MEVIYERLLWVDSGYRRVDRESFRYRAHKRTPLVVILRGV
jgi:hypothetical protein